MTIESLFQTSLLLWASLHGDAVAQCTFAQSSRPQPVILYRFAVHTAGDTTMLGVTLEFTGSRSGGDTINVPLQWAGERLRSMRNLRALDAGVQIDSIPNRDARLVRHRPGARVRLSYDLAKDWSGPLDHPYEFHPMIFGDYVEVSGENALVGPRLDPYTPVVAQFDWSDVPASWTVATSFGTAEGTSDARTDDARCQTFSGTLRDLRGALFAAGDFRVTRFLIGQKPAVLAIRGTWPFSDSAVVGEVQREVGLVREFWRDDNFPYFLVTWAPFDREHNSGDGTAFTNALWIFMSRLDSLSTQITQLTHESFHAWDPRLMGREANADTRNLGWFHEGFTVYYADMIAYRAGLVSLGDVVRRANRDLRNFNGSSDPYTRGDVMARWLDGAIRDHSQGAHSLDDAMRDMVRDAARPLTLDRVLSTIGRYLSPADQTTLREMATGSGAPPASLSPGELRPCVRVALDSVYAFDAGLDVKASVNARRVSGVRAGSAAYAAGMRDGQSLVGWSIYNGDSDRPATFTIQVDSARQRISYYPRGAGAVAPQLHIVDGSAARSGVCGISSK